MAAILPWDAIKQEYVEGKRSKHGSVMYPTYEDLARKYTCAFSTVATRAAREEWPAARRAYQAALICAQQAKVQREVDTQDMPIDAASLIDADWLECAQRGLAFLKNNFTIAWAEQASMIELELLSRTVANFQSVGRSAPPIMEGYANVG